MPEIQNFKRKRGNRSSYIVNPDGNCTPSDSEDEDHDQIVQRKIVRRDSTDESVQIENESSNSNSSDGHRSNHGNNQLLHAALQKIQELENELAELDDADYDSGHQDDEDEIDEGNGSDFEENHDHRNDILEGQAEALGFAFCVKETFEYLAAEGIAQDNPIVASLRERFLGQCD
ncbi:uncharacterized protein LOC116346665 [Contarinia nasturtii]|uniref:uncharacterized protein LOC116346665 n=1 Tax=Contarinia nasturtii TaxID=265458 RepID=UPI0012D376F6|nr:uncharacterized protein LOC116346665 [Contarinia nasturtii]